MGFCGPNQFKIVQPGHLSICIFAMYLRTIVIVKLDFAKDFDMVEHDAILQIMEKKGFDSKWLAWVKEILSSGSSFVLLNGIPGKQFICKRGVRQGDPLSPLLYSFASDLLQSAVNELVRQGVNSRPIQTNDDDFPIVHYADVPINVSSDLMDELARDFGCQIGGMPFTYLGLPLGTTRPTMSDLSPIVFRLERKLTSISSFLSQGARLQLITSALASMPLHFLCALHLPPGLTKQFDRIFRQCLWRDKYDEPKQSLAAWDMVCKPFQKQNAALLIKFLDKFYNHKDVPWVNLIWHAHYRDKVPHAENLCGYFWWKDVLKLVDNFRGIAAVKMGKGNTFLFWSDNCIVNHDNVPLKSRFPRLFSYVLNENVSAAEAYSTIELADMFYLPLSTIAYQEL
jgi:hypothetical protein